MFSVELIILSGVAVFVIKNSSLNCSILDEIESICAFWFLDVIVQKEE